MEIRHPGHPSSDQRSVADAFAGDGTIRQPVARASCYCQAHRARPVAGPQDHHPCASHLKGTIAGRRKDLRNGSRSIKEIVQFDDEELTEEKIEAKTRDTLKEIDKVGKLYLLAAKQVAKLEKIPRSKKRPYLHARFELSRTRVEMSKLVRELDFNVLEKKRLIDKIHQTVERVYFLEREIGEARAPRGSVQSRRSGRGPQGSEGPPPGT